MKKNKLGIFFIFVMIFGILFAIPFPNGFILGDRLLEGIGLNAWSNGTNYAAIYSLLLIVIAWTGINETFGKRYPKVTRKIYVLFLLLFLAPIILNSLK